MKRHLSMAGLLIWILAASLFISAQESPSEVGVKFLLLVDTSVAMQKKQQASAALVRDMIRSGFNGQIKEGDKYNLWTFNESVSTKKFSVETWKGEEKELLAEIAAQFVLAQHYTGRTESDAGIAALISEASVQPELTGIIVTDAESKISGLRFDDAINQKIVQERVLNAGREKPLVAMLVFKNGACVDWAVSLGSANPRLGARAADLAGLDAAEEKARQILRNAPPPIDPFELARRMLTNPPPPKAVEVVSSNSPAFIVVRNQQSDLPERKEEVRPKPKLHVKILKVENVDQPMMQEVRRIPPPSSHLAPAPSPDASKTNLPSPNIPEPTIQKAEASEPVSTIADKNLQRDPVAVTSVTAEAERENRPEQAKSGTAPRHLYSPLMMIIPGAFCGLSLAVWLFLRRGKHPQPSFISQSLGSDGMEVYPKK